MRKIFCIENSMIGKELSTQDYFDCRTIDFGNTGEELERVNTDNIHLTIIPVMWLDINNPDWLKEGHISKEERYTLFRQIFKRSRYILVDASDENFSLIQYVKHNTEIYREFLNHFKIKKEKMKFISGTTNALSDSRSQYYVPNLSIVEDYKFNILFVHYRGVFHNCEDNWDFEKEYNFDKKTSFTSFNWSVRDKRQALLGILKKSNLTKHISEGHIENVESPHFGDESRSSAIKILCENYFDEYEFDDKLIFNNFDWTGMMGESCIDFVDDTWSSFGEEVSLQSSEKLHRGAFFKQMVIPFTGHNQIKNLKKYVGIDYFWDLETKITPHDFDNIRETADRFIIYMEYVKEILKYDDEKILELYKKNIDKIESNKNIVMNTFHDRKKIVKQTIKELEIW
jgi:hypothetical protein